MPVLADDLPEIQYRYECVDGDVWRFTRGGMRVWPVGNWGLAVTAVFEAVCFIALSLVFGTWWFLLGLPAVLGVIALITLLKSYRANRRLLSPGSVMSAGYSDTALRLEDGGVTLTVAYSRLEQVTRMRGFVVVKVRKGRRILIPEENAPAEAVAKIRAGIAAA
ncbi:hypothetical protein [Gordonia sp. (in: high G+C Gram-positive bacteria)]|uniref:hypothetical protein n=1 Tax=Gordonia sp. (in: high G+C Gram-positive bacteria) TaxID=84139 RepID=UPI002603B712|nr:hypothetical protein [Gordonia sp. (in: high G+C Gram-positive bacteria)]